MIESKVVLIYHPNRYLYFQVILRLRKLFLLFMMQSTHAIFLFKVDWWSRLDWSLEKMLSCSKLFARILVAQFDSYVDLLSSIRSICLKKGWSLHIWKSGLDHFYGGFLLLRLQRQIFLGSVHSMHILVHLIDLD